MSTFRKGTRVRIVRDSKECGFHDIEIGTCGVVEEVFDGKPHDGNALMWREDGERYARIRFDNGRECCCWFDEIEKE